MVSHCATFNIADFLLQTTVLTISG